MNNKKRTKTDKYGEMPDRRKSPLVDEEYGFTSEEFLAISRYVSVWYIDESSDTGYSVKGKPHFVLSAYTSLEATNYEKIFEEIPKDYSKYDNGEYHFNYLWRLENGSQLCLKLTKRLGAQSVVILNLVEYKDLNKIPLEKPKDLYRSYIEVMLDAIDYVDTSLRKVIIIDNTDLLDGDFYRSVSRSNRYVLPGKSHLSLGLQTADTIASSLGVSVNPGKDGKVYRSVFEPLKKRSWNVRRWLESRKTQTSEADNQWDSEYIKKRGRK